MIKLKAGIYNGDAECFLGDRNRNVKYYLGNFLSTKGQIS